MFAGYRETPENCQENLDFLLRSFLLPNSHSYVDAPPFVTLSLAQVIMQLGKQVMVQVMVQVMAQDCAEPTIS